MTLHFKNDKFELEGNRLTISNVRLAKKVNALLQRYPDDTQFSNSDEALFKLPPSNDVYLSVCKVLGLKLNN